VGWLYWVETNARRNMTMGSQTEMEFRDSKSVGKGNTALFQLQSVNPVKVWDITNPQNVDSIVPLSTSGGFQFEDSATSLRQYIAFSSNSKLLDSSVTYFGPVVNQNLHADSAVDMVIVSSPLFLSQAEQLKKFHETHDSLTSIIVTPQQIYNEFS
jgi:hypothetical protein